MQQNDSSSMTEPPSIPTTGPRWRHWGVAAGLISGVADVLGFRALGVPFVVADHDITWFVAAYFAVSFAVLGYLIGYLIEQRRREREMAALVRRQIETLGALRERLAQSEKLAALGQLAASIAHEVRNPLGVIRSAAQSIDEGLADRASADERDACRFITAEIDRLNTVITSLLAFARPLVVDTRPTPVAELVTRALQLAERDLERKRIRVQRSDRSETVRADPDLATQMLVDLLANACDASPEGGAISVATRSRDGLVEIDVADEGPGVPDDVRERIFEPFFSTRAEGTGLGLAVARQIARAHGGDVRVATSAARSGARFVLTLQRSTANEMTA